MTEQFVWDADDIEIDPPDPDLPLFRDEYLAKRDEIPVDPELVDEPELLEGAMTIGIAPMCYSCIHKKEKRLTCEAFPDGIPNAILLSQEDHRKPFVGDGDIQFEQDPLKEVPSEVFEVFDGRAQEEA